VSHLKGGRAQEEILFVHVNEKSAFNDPFCPREAGASLYAFQLPLTGFSNMAKDNFVALLTELGVCGKDSVKIATEVLMYTIATITTQRIIILLMDCGPLNHGNMIAQILIQFMVDLGLCDHAEVIFFVQRHGKGDCDGHFGNIAQVQQTNATIGIDCAMRNIETVDVHKAKNTKCQAFCGMPDAYVDLAQFFNK
jgi:hypothetical protein